MNFLKERHRNREKTSFRHPFTPSPLTTNPIMSPMSKSNLSLQFVESLTQRLISLLPNRTGSSPAEIELNTQYLITKSLILSNSRYLTKKGDNSDDDFDDFKDKQFISNVFQCFCNLLDSIHYDSNHKIRTHDEKSLTSLIVVLRLLSAVIKHILCDKRLLINSDRNNNTDHQLHIIAYSFNSTSSYLDTNNTPPKLDQSIIENIIDTFISLNSLQPTRKVISLIRRSPVERYHISDTSSSSNNTNPSPISSTNDSNVNLFSSNDMSSISSDDLNFYIEEIDNNLELIYKYIASANPQDYCNYLNGKLFGYLKTGEVLPLPVIQKYSPLLQYVHYNESIANSLINDVYSILPSIKSNTWRQVLLVFFTRGMKYKWINDPEMYNHIFEPFSKLELVCKNLFDYVSAMFEGMPHSGCSSMIQSHLAILCVGDFMELDTKPNKIKLAFNKRLKFVTNILKDSSTCNNLECFESLINIFHLVAKFPPNLYSHPVYKFCVSHIDETFENLNKMVISFNNDDASLLYDKLVVDFYISAILIKPQTYLDVITSKFNECKENLKEVRILIRIIKGLSELNKASLPFLKLMNSLSSQLKLMIFGTFKILMQAEANVNYPHQTVNSLSLFSPSNVSITSDDKFHYDYFHKSRFIAQFNSKRTSLDHYLSDISSSRNFDAQTDDLIAKTIVRQSAFLNSPQNPLLSQNNNSSVIVSSSASSSFSYKNKWVGYAEEVMSYLFAVFIAVPELYFNDDNYPTTTADKNEKMKKIDQFASEVTVPLKFAFQYKPSVENSELFEAASALALALVEADFTTNSHHDKSTSDYSKFVISNYIIESISDACLQFSLADAKFKSIFLFLTHFLQSRGSFLAQANNELIEYNTGFEEGASVGQSMEKILLLTLCTHDFQFYSVAKVTMKWYVSEITKEKQDSLADTFHKIVEDDTVFTGFVSLHKRIRNMLREAKPTQSLYHIWIVIYYRWMDLLESKSSLSEESLIFRHFTGFLVSTAGAFLLEEFAKNDLEQKAQAKEFVAEFFDKAVSFLTSSDLVIRVVIKDALSNESHSASYHLICTTFLNVGQEYVESKVVSEEGILFIEQMIIIITAMIMIENDGAFVLVALLPEVCEFIIKFINAVPNLSDILRLKLRFCKLACAIEADKPRVGLNGAFKLRNFYAKSSAAWLEQAVFFEEYNNSDDSSSITSPTSAASIKSPKESETMFLYLDLANESSKALSLQLENIILEIPEGTKDEDIRKCKDLAFGNYFSLFYRILQKYAKPNLNSTMIKSKYKIHLITDNVLKCISNILHFDADIGLQFVLPMGYHENKKIRSIFLNVFAHMLSTRKNREDTEEFSDELVERLSELYEVYGAAAEIALSSEHNLLASALFGLFSYSKKLDKLFVVLLKDEISVISRSTDIFRRNSTLTKLLSNFAKDYGLDYLSATLVPFIEELVKDEVAFEVEKKSDKENTESFMKYFSKLVGTIINSLESVPSSFKFICSEIYKCVKQKFEDAALIAVGSFIFLRFFCPAIISPSTFFSIPNIEPKVKRSLMQLVKVIQNMANGSLGLLKWPGLANESERLNELNERIFDFLEKVFRTDFYGGSSEPSKEGSKECESTEYPFHSLSTKPIAELRYLHKYLYTYFVNIKLQYILTDPLVNLSNLHERIENFRKLDSLLNELGQPKALISLQISNSFRNFDPNNTVNYGPYNDFMSKMSMRNLEIPVDAPVVHNAIFNDGTPAVIINFYHVEQVQYDAEVLVFRLLELSSQVWDNKFYMVFDFTGFTYLESFAKSYVSILRAIGPPLFFKNCLRIYYFNIPKSDYINIFKAMRELRIENNDHPARIFTYSQEDDKEIVESLCLDDTTLSISRDVRVVYKTVKMYEEKTGEFKKVTLKIGRQWFQICGDFIEFSGPLLMTKGFYPVEVLRLSDISKCETTNITGFNDEFTITLSVYGYKITLRSPERQGILRFLYFTTSRLPKQLTNDPRISEETEVSFHWFARLYNSAFHGLLEDDEEVRSSAALLFSSLSAYFDIDFGISTKHAKFISFPQNTTDYIVGVSEYLAQNVGFVSYRFFKAFFNNFEKLRTQDIVSGIMYISPWVDNICEHIFLDTDENGEERVAEIVRQFCKITAKNKDQMSCLNDYVWKKLFKETRLTSIVLEEVIAFAINDERDHPSILAVITPSVDVCGEVIMRLLNSVSDASLNDSTVALQSKLLEITILVKISASLFFNSYVFAQLYLADVFFLCSLFIDNPVLEFGADLQKLVVNTMQSFVHKPRIDSDQLEALENTISYFSGPRAKMLFGMTRDKGFSGADASQIFNRATSFEILCDYMNELIGHIGTSDDKLRWRTRWCTRALDLTFKTDSIFHGRAVLVVGVLSKNGVNDFTVARIMKMIGRNERNTLEYSTNLSVAAARLFKGFSATSYYPRKFVWPMFCLAYMNYGPIYQPAIQCLTSIVSKVIESNRDLCKIVDDERQFLEPHIKDYENDYGVTFLNTNFEIHVFFIVAQGLKVPQMKHTSIECMKQAFKTRYNFRPPEEKDYLSVDNVAMPFFFFLFLNLSESQLEEYMEDIGFECTRYASINKSKIPRIMIDFICTKSELAKMTLLIAAYYYDHESVDNSFKARFLEFYSYLFKTDNEMSFLIYHIVRPTFHESFVNSNNIEVISTISGIKSSLINNKDYDAEKYIQKEASILAANKCEVMKTMNPFRPLETEEQLEVFSRRSKALRDIIYASACSFVEGQTLE